MRRIDPIDEHEMRIIHEACEAALVILDKIDFRRFKVRIIELDENDE